MNDALTSLAGWMKKAAEYDSFIRRSHVIFAGAMSRHGGQRTHRTFTPHVPRKEENMGVPMDVDRIDIKEQE